MAGQLTFQRQGVKSRLLWLVAGIRQSRIRSPFGSFGVRQFIAHFSCVAALGGSCDRFAESGDESPHSKKGITMAIPRSRSDLNRGTYVGRMLRLFHAYGWECDICKGKNLSFLTIHHEGGVGIAASERAELGDREKRKLLRDFEQTRKKDPRIRVLCANCHAKVHAKKDVMLSKRHVNGLL